jgi:chromosome segregation ATPase
MDETSYWQAFERGTAIAVSADVARASLLALGPLVSDTHADLAAVQSQLRDLREAPGRRGAGWTRATLNAEIARLERQERRLTIRREGLREHEARMQEELARLAPQRESTGRLLEDLTRDFEALAHKEANNAR